MGQSGIIDRSKTAKDSHVEEGMDSEIIASVEQCDSDILFYVYGVLEPGARTSPHVHDNCEIAWFLEEGEALWAMGSADGKDVDVRKCETMNAGYVAPGELHWLLNPGDTRAVFLMAYVGVNNAKDAHGRTVAVPERLRELLAEHNVSV